MIAEARKAVFELARTIARTDYDVIQDNVLEHDREDLKLTTVVVGPGTREKRLLTRGGLTDDRYEVLVGVLVPLFKETDLDRSDIGFSILEAMARKAMGKKLGQFRVLGYTDELTQDQEKWRNTRAATSVISFSLAAFGG